MTISKRVRSQFYTCSTTAAATASRSGETTTAAITTAPLNADAQPATTLIRLPLTRPIPGKRKRKSRANKSLVLQRQGRGWSDEEHDRFLHALELYPAGPWKNVAAFVGTRTTRQVMTHAQKYRQKIARRQRGLQIPVRKCVSATVAGSPTPVTTAVEETTATRTTSAETTQEEIKSDEPGFVMEPETARDSVGLCISTTTSPSSADHALNKFSFFSLNSADLPESSSCYPVAMTADEFTLVAEELYAELDSLLWMNQFEGDFTPTTIQHDVEYFADPLALMLQDPSSTFSWSPSNNKNFSMDVVYPAYASVDRVSLEMPYECRL